MVAKSLIAFLLLIFSGLSLAADEGIHVEYGEIESPNLEKVRERLQAAGTMEAVADTINSVVRLPGLKAIQVNQCGAANAFYKSQRISGKPEPEMVFCYEMAASFMKQMEKEKIPDSIQPQLLEGAIGFVMLHELGHALMDITRLPIFSQEENAADAIATWLILYEGRNDWEFRRRYLAGGLWTQVKDDLTAEYTREHLSDPHSLANQRLINIACLALGVGGKEYAALVPKTGMSLERAKGCRAEFEQLNRSVAVTLRRFIVSK